MVTTFLKHPLLGAKDEFCDILRKIKKLKFRRMPARFYNRNSRKRAKISGNIELSKRGDTFEIFVRGGGGRRHGDKKWWSKKSHKKNRYFFKCSWSNPKKGQFSISAFTIRQYSFSSFIVLDNLVLSVIIHIDIFIVFSGILDLAACIPRNS